LDEAQEEERVYQLARRNAVLHEKKRIVRRYQKRDILAIMVNFNSSVTSPTDHDNDDEW
jgi:hypothetical protein